MTENSDRETNRTEHAGSAWTEIREDGVPLLVYDNDRGETKAVELSPEAVSQLRRDFINGPSVRNDVEETDE